MKRIGIVIFLSMTAMLTRAQIEVSSEVRMTASDGDHSPLWLNANQYGLSSTETSSGYVRYGVFRPSENDSTGRWAWGAGADLAVASGMTSTLVVQQAYGEVRLMKMLLTVGSKEQPMELKNQTLSSGSQTLGINARPVPSVRLSLPHYWSVPGTRRWVAIKGHAAFGLQTDDRWQRDFTRQERKYTRHTRIHTKAGYLRIGQPGRPFALQLGLEMGCQYGGTSYYIDGNGQLARIDNKQGLTGMWHALIPDGYEANEKDIIYKNVDGNHLGSMVGRISLDYPSWGVAAYFDHFFEDHSQIFFFSKNSYGTGDDWDKKVNDKFFVYDVRDAMLGVEISLKRVPWVDHIVGEYVYTKYQSGPVYHDHTQHMPDQIFGKDNYYNHAVFSGWQHWGQVMGNPLYRSPLYNDDHQISVEDNRFWAWHIGVDGRPARGLSYRALCSWQRGFGTYDQPFADPRRNLSLMGEVAYSFADSSPMQGWSLKAAIGIDHGSLLGDNTGLQLTVAKRMNIEKETNH